MTELTQPFDRVVYWKDIGQNVPAPGLIVDPAPPMATSTRITPNFKRRLSLGDWSQGSDRTAAAQRDTMVFFEATGGADVGTAWLIWDVTGSTDRRTADERTGLSPADLDFSSVSGADFAPLAIGPGLAIPPAVQRAESLSIAVYPADYEVAPTIRVRWPGDFSQGGDLRLPVDRTVLVTTNSRQTLYMRLPINRDGPMWRTLRTLDHETLVTIEALPVYWMVSAAEGPYVLRSFFAARDDSQVETVEYSTTIQNEALTQVATVVRATSFICRQIGLPPREALLSEGNTWDASGDVWKVRSIEHVDRNRVARLQCTLFTP